MSKTTQRNNELAALSAMNDGGAPVAADKSEDLSRDFNIRKNHPLPDGFVNPECGEPGHRCIGNDGKYHPEWIQLRIDGVYEGQANPQKFPLGGSTYLIPLDEWLDAPPEVLVSLKGAVETHHTQKPPTPGEIALGKKPEHKVITRNRFVYQSLPSC